MNLKKDGIIWATLRLYGYREFSLEDGQVSLCKAFWSIVVGLPFALLFRGIAYVARLLWGGVAAWAQWSVEGARFYRDSSAEGRYRPILDPKGLGRMALRLASAPALVLLCVLVARGFGAMLTVAFVLLGVLGALVAGIVGAVYLTTHESLQEVGDVIREGLSSMKSRVCPQLRFR